MHFWKGRQLPSFTSSLYFLFFSKTGKCHHNYYATLPIKLHPTPKEDLKKMLHSGMVKINCAMETV